VGCPEGRNKLAASHEYGVKTTHPAGDKGGGRKEKSIWRNIVSKVRRHAHDSMEKGHSNFRTWARHESNQIRRLRGRGGGDRREGLDQPSLGKEKVRAHPRDKGSSRPKNSVSIAWDIHWSSKPGGYGGTTGHKQGEGSSGRPAKEESSYIFGATRLAKRTNALKMAFEKMKKKLRQKTEERKRDKKLLRWERVPSYAEVKSFSHLREQGGLVWGREGGEKENATGASFYGAWEKERPCISKLETKKCMGMDSRP